MRVKVSLQTHMHVEGLVNGLKFSIDMYGNPISIETPRADIIRMNEFRSYLTNYLILCQDVRSLSIIEAVEKWERSEILLKF